MLGRELRHGEPELGILPLICDPTRTFVDVGANRGVYSYRALEFCSHVYALEAHPTLAAPLRRVLGRRGTVLNVAASDKRGNAQLAIPFRDGVEVDTRSTLEANANPGFELRTTSVETYPIDDLDLGPVGVIKIDVEGHEHSVLEGAIGTLTHDKPVVIVECEERHHAGGVERTFSLLEGLGYRGYFLQKGILRDGREFDPKVLQDVDKASSGQIRTGEYINNFIFIHPERNSSLSRLRERYS
jgi:FkbM family methyltransferase